MSTYDLRLQGAIDATSVAKDAGGTDDLRATLIEELDQRGVQTGDESWLQMVVHGITSDPDFMTDEEPDDFVADDAQ